jgi:hypothetical protein
MSCAVLAAGKLGQRPTRSFECLVALRLPDGTWPARPGETKGDAMATYWACVTCHYCALLFEGARVNLEPTLDAIEKGRLATAPLPSVEAVLRWLAHHEPETDRRLDALMLALGDHVPQWRSGAEAARMDYLDWHAGTNAAWYDCDALWQQWYAALQAALVLHQRTDGAHAGSWDPVDKNGKEGGRVYATAVNVFSLANGQHRDRDGRGGAAKK